MLQPCINALNIVPSGVYVDVTFGGGGHSAEILKHISSGHLYAFDQDTDALTNKINDQRFTLIQANFLRIVPSVGFALGLQFLPYCINALSRIHLGANESLYIVRPETL